LCPLPLSCDGEDVVVELDCTSLRCAECGRQADETADGWRAYLAVIDESDEDLEVEVFCPECAEREFEDPASRSRPRLNAAQALAELLSLARFARSAKQEAKGRAAAPEALRCR
jgi:hypothetical protein